MKTIIAPTDFSPSSLNAVNYAADLATILNAKLLLMNVVQIPISLSEIPMPEPVFEEMITLARQDLDDLGDKLNEKANGKLSISTEITVGTVEHQITEISNLEKPIAIVMDMRSGHRIERFLMGSNALFALQHLLYPILIVPENLTFHAIKKIGLACDLQITKTLPLESIKTWLACFGASLDIVYISQNAEKAGSVNGKISFLQNSLAEFHPKFHFSVNQDIAEGLENFAKQQELDLLIIVPRKHGFWGLFDEKHSKKIIMHEQIPVLAVHEIEK